MPELPEIETLRRSLATALPGHKLENVRIHRTNLRVPFPDFKPVLGQVVRAVERRSKYLLLVFDSGRVLIHLGMSGSLTWGVGTRRKHDHLELFFEGIEKPLRLHDPRRFGSVQYEPVGELHPSLRRLGPEPLDPTFKKSNFRKLFSKSKVPIKVALMDPSIIVGVGNIYATEALFRAHIDPRLPANAIAPRRLDILFEHVKDVLNEGILRGGSTLRDFHGLNGEVGTFAATVQVYGRAGQPCPVCGHPLSSLRQGGRATVYCSTCQN